MGVCFIGGNISITFINILIYWIFWSILWRFCLVLKIPRPIIDCIACKNDISHDIINQYAFPDPYFVTTLMFSISFIVIQYHINGYKTPFIHYIVVAFVTITYSVVEVMLERMYIWQMMANILLSIGLEIVLIFILKLAIEDKIHFISISWIGKLINRNSERNDTNE
jgi:hypothetical protein